MRRALIAVCAAALCGAIAASVGAGTVNGTKGNDVLRGTAAADKLYGLGGNDRLYGLAGNDYLNGGPGSDTIVCGPGHDTVVADPTDKIAADCETVLGLPKPTVSVAGGSQAEGNSGTAPLTFTVTLSKASKLRVTVAYATADGTAAAGSDYTATRGTLVFAPGETSKTVAVAIVGDAAVEPDETFTLTLSGPVNATLGTASATGTITNDDVKATAGHYHGPITTGGFIDFDVSADGSSVTNLQIFPYLTCTPADGSGTYPLGLSGSTPIGSDLTFDGGGSGDGVTVTLKGKFQTSPALANGTLQIHIAYDDSGTHYECDTGSASWAAVLRS
jgi:Ca2+-binding RTX toxin-like protein